MRDNKVGAYMTVLCKSVDFIVLGCEAKKFLILWLFKTKKIIFEKNMENNNNQSSNVFYWGMNLRNFTTLLHISQFAGFVVPYAGFILPIVMWVTNKDQNEVINQHGKNILNWLISGTIYAIVAGILSFILIGILLLVAVGICAVIFPIIGAVKSSNDEIWQYPLTVQFFK